MYSYVGNAAIVYWPKKEGLEREQFLRAIFDFFQEIERKKDLFMSNYEGQPNFKVGIDIGEVTVKEIGVSRREILFLGDVINNVSRLVEMQQTLHLNPIQDKVFVTEELITLLNKVPEGLKTVHLGEIDLRGRKETQSIYLVNRASSSISH